MFVQPPKKSHYSIGPPGSSLINNQGLLWEVLVCLPTKSLMRFKSVSKLWYSVIRNHKFAIAYNKRGSGGGCFRGLLCCNTSERPRCFFYANFNNRPRLLHCHMTIQDSGFTYTIVVKGLIGFYKYKHNQFTLCNIATHEFLNLPPSPFRYNDLNNYLIGFDPVNQVYKALNIRSHHGAASSFTGKFNRTSYVFTLGVNNSDKQWRKIDPPSDLNFDFEECVYISGVLYWRSYDIQGNNQQTLLAFHLNSETFETIAIPDCIGYYFYLVEICGSPSVIVRNGTSDLEIWTIKNHCKGDGLEAWTRKRVLLPMSLHQIGSLDFAGTLPTGETMLLGEYQSYNLPLVIFVYDHLKNEMSSITIEGYGSQETGLDGPEKGSELQQIKICYYEENIISLACLMNNHPNDQIIYHN